MIHPQGNHSAEIYTQMATDAQNEANRKNAQKSTGPRTEAGKSRTRLNATRHNLCAHVPFTTDEGKTEGDSEQFQLLLADLRLEHHPDGSNTQRNQVPPSR